MSCDMTANRKHVKYASVETLYWYEISSKHFSEKPHIYKCWQKSILPPIFERSSPLFERHDVVSRQVLDPLVQLLHAQLRQGLIGDLGNVHFQISGDRSEKKLDRFVETDN